jgi:hypothetical protein
LFGVVKGFWKLLLSAWSGEGPRPWYLLSRNAKKIMTSRAKDFIITNDFGRKYNDIVIAKGSYVMEEWLHFTETFSVHVLSGILDATLTEMWRSLRYEQCCMSLTAVSA